MESSYGLDLFCSGWVSLADLSGNVNEGIIGIITGEEDNELTEIKIHKNTLSREKILNCL